MDTVAEAPSGPVDWRLAARELADQIAAWPSRWYRPVVQTPRHLFVPRWWAPTGQPGWVLRDGPTDPPGWATAAYADRSLVTRIGPHHADHATADQHPAGLPTSSSTKPALTLAMLRHARLGAGDGLEVLDVGTGSGYGTALLAAHLGDRQVTSVDVDPYLTKAATHRLNQAGLHPTVLPLDATGPLPGTYDRIIASVSVRPIPPSWLAALRPGGILVTTIRNLSIILVAARTPDGGAVGGTARDWAMYMPTRTGPTYPPSPAPAWTQLTDADGDQVGPGRPYPIPDILEAWELRSMLELEVATDLDHHYEQTLDGRRTAWMAHPDGSWARATATPGDTAPTVHQAGPRRLWDGLDELRTRWLAEGRYPIYGAKARIDPDGTLHLRRGTWQTTIR